jgi:hypothetical protein
VDRIGGVRKWACSHLVYRIGIIMERPSKTTNRVVGNNRNSNPGLPIDSEILGQTVKLRNFILLMSYLTYFESISDVYEKVKLLKPSGNFTYDQV